MRDTNLRRDALGAWQTGPSRREATRVSGGAVYTRGGIDRGICHPTRQQVRLVTTPPHRVVNRPSLTAAASPTANPLSSVLSRPALARGWNRPPFRPGPLWARVDNRPVNDVCHGVASGRQVYQGGIDRRPRFPHTFRQGQLLPQINTPCWIARKEVTSRQPGAKPEMCMSKDNIGSPKTNIGSPNRQERQFLPQVGSWKCRYPSANPRGSGPWREPSGVQRESDDAHRL